MSKEIKINTSNKKENIIPKKLSSEINPEPIPKEIMLEFKEDIKKIMKKYPQRRNKRKGEKLKYKNTFCYAVLEKLAAGKNKVTVASELGISYQRFCSWRKIYPEFNYACHVGEQLSLRYWTEIGRLNLHNKNFNHILWMMNMTNRFRWFSNRNKEEKKILKKEEKILEVNIDDSRIARIVNLAANNTTIVEAGKLIENKQEVYSN